MTYVLSLLLFLCTPALHGLIDSSFGTQGVADGSGSVASIAMDANQKIMFTGTNNDQNRIVVGRYLSNGTLDPLFNGTGLNADEVGRGKVVALDNTGRVIVAASNDAGGDFVIFAYTATGALDTAGFNAPNGFRQVIFNDQGPRALAIQNDNQIIIAGIDNSTSDFGVFRVTANGSSQQAFVNAGPGTVYGLAIDSIGRIIAVGEDTNNFKVIRYAADGLSFETFSPAGTGQARSVAIQTDGKIVVAGLNATADHITLVRYNTNGTLDASFGIGGIVAGQAITSPADIAPAVAIQSSGLIVVGASTSPAGSFQLTNYKADGSLGGFGLILDPTGELNGITLQSDGKIVAGGIMNAMNYRITRYTIPADSYQLEQVVTQSGGIADITPVAQDGIFISTSSSTSGVRVSAWMPSVNTPIQFTPPVDGAITSVDRDRINPDKFVTAVAGPQSAALIYDLSNPANPPIVLQHAVGSTVNSAQYDDLGDMIVSVDNTGIAKTWLADGASIISYTGHSAGANITTGRFIDQGAYAGMVVSTSTSAGAFEVRVWDPMTGDTIASKSFATANAVLTGLSDDAISQFAINCFGPSCVPDAALISIETIIGPDGTVTLYNPDSILADSADRVASAQTISAYATALFTRAPNQTTLSNNLGMIFIGTDDGYIGAISSAQPINGSMPITLIPVTPGSPITWMDASAIGNTGFLGVTSEDGSARVYRVTHTGVISLVNVIPPVTSASGNVGRRIKFKTLQTGNAISIGWDVGANGEAQRWRL